MKDDYHWHWWHWLIVIIVVIVFLGMTYTWMKNYTIIKRDNQSITNGTRQVIEHPIKTTENTINNITH